MVFLYMLLAFGWTINKNSVGMEELDIILPVGCFVVVMHVLIGSLIFIDNEEHHKFHDYSGVQGLLLCAFRLLMFLGFIFGIIKSKRELKD